MRFYQYLFSAFYLYILDHPRAYWPWTDRFFAAHLYFFLHELFSISFMHMLWFDEYDYPLPTVIIILLVNLLVFRKLHERPVAEAIVRSYPWEILKVAPVMLWLSPFIILAIKFLEYQFR